MLRRSLASSIAIAIATVIVLAGCGGGDDDDSSASTTTTTIVITTTTTDPNAEPDDPFCGTFERFREVILLPQNTVEQARARAAQLSAAAAALVAVAPEELAADLSRLATAAEELEVATAAATTIEETQAAEQALQQDPDVAAANEAITVWLADGCATE